MSHNKKRNIAFLYEVLLREGTKAAINQDLERIKLVKSIILEHFSNDSILKKELDLYHSLQENTVEDNLAEKFVKEVESRYDKLDKRTLFNEQTRLINHINKSLGMSVYNTFVPNYKDFASIAQIFNSSTPIKQKILLEQTIIDKIKIVKEEKDKNTLQPIDNLVFKTFNKKFNEKYGSLLSEQKELLSKYVNSFNNNGIELKIYMNEEVKRLKEGLEKALDVEEIKSDPSMADKTRKTINYLNDFKQVKEITQDMLQKVIKIQQFVHEVSK